MAGGVYYCAENHFQEKLQTYGDSAFFSFNLKASSIWSKAVQPTIINPIYQSVGVCMTNPENTHNARFNSDKMKLIFIDEFEKARLISPKKNIAKQKVFIYHGTKDDVIKSSMSEMLHQFYSSMGVPEKSITTVHKDGGHNFPTDRNDGISCDEEKVPYIANCNYDLAKNILENLLGRKLDRAPIRTENLYAVTQKNNPDSIQTYGYLYANQYCLNNPSNCDLHVALHGCKMSDDYDEEFQSFYESKVQLTRVLGIDEQAFKVRHRQMGARIFALNSGYAEYAETKSNRLMIYFPQTRISQKNYPANPKGCWDWYGWTGPLYATNKGSETQWLMEQIQLIRKNPRSLIIKN